LNMGMMMERWQGASILVSMPHDGEIRGPRGFRFQAWRISFPSNRMKDPSPGTT